MPDNMKKTPGDNRMHGALERDLGFQTEDEKILDLLMRYCSDASDQALTEEEREKIRHILSTDPYWQKVFEEIKDDYRRMIDSIRATDIPRLLTSMPKKGLPGLFRMKVQQILPVPSVRIGLASVVLAAFLYGAAALTSAVVTPETMHLAKFGKESLALRGEQTVPVEALDALQSGRFDEAIDRLRALAITRLDSATEATVDYFLGIALLQSAERAPLNLFPSYDHTTVLNGMRYLQNALRISHGDDRRRDFQDACRFALGKASLMLNDIPKAESYFLQVNERNNPYRMPARIILNSLSR